MCVTSLLTGIIALRVPGLSVPNYRLIRLISHAPDFVVDPFNRSEHRLQAWSDDGVPHGICIRLAENTRSGIVKISGTPYMPIDILDENHDIFAVPNAFNHLGCLILRRRGVGVTSNVHCQEMCPDEPPE